MAMPTSFGRKSGYYANYLTRPVIYRSITTQDMSVGAATTEFDAIPTFTLDNTRVGQQSLFLDYLPNPTSSFLQLTEDQPIFVGTFALFYDMSGAEGHASALTTLVNHKIWFFTNPDGDGLYYPQYWNMMALHDVYLGDTHHVIDGIYPGTYKLALVTPMPDSFNKIVVLRSSFE